MKKMATASVAPELPFPSNSLRELAAQLDAYIQQGSAPLESDELYRNFGFHEYDQVPPAFPQSE